MVRSRVLLSCLSARPERRRGGRRQAEGRGGGGGELLQPGGPRTAGIRTAGTGPTTTGLPRQHSRTRSTIFAKPPAPARRPNKAPGLFVLHRRAGAGGRVRRRDDAAPATVHTIWSARRVGPTGCPTHKPTKPRRSPGQSRFRTRRCLIVGRKVFCAIRGSYTKGAISSAGKCPTVGRGGKVVLLRRLCWF